MKASNIYLKTFYKGFVQFYNLETQNNQKKIFIQANPALFQIRGKLD